jgi:ubiquinone biosynthesis protein
MSGPELQEVNGGYEILVENKSESFFRRYFLTVRHGLGLSWGALYTFIQQQKELGRGWSPFILILRILMMLAWPFLNRDLIKLPFPVQFRRRLEMLGPTYIKLGQILSLREDLLPKSITDELKNLLDRLPALPFPRYLELINKNLPLPVWSVFSEIDSVPLGSASLAQTHRAVLRSGEEIVIKLLKPNVRQIVVNDTRWLRVLGSFLQIFLARYQPKRLIAEFCRYTLLEVDLRNEAANAEIFAANFQEEPDIRFPQVYRDVSNENMLCMEFFRGSKPNAAVLAKLSNKEIDKVIHLGVGATLQMIFRDGFFHADLHPGNLIIFDDGGVGFIDLGMIGRFDNDMRKRMLYYFYALVMGDPAAAARYLLAMTIAGPRSDPEGFRRAVEDLNRRWLRSPNFDEFSLGNLILQSVSIAGRYYIQYPGEIILMVKSLVTLEGVGNVLAPGIDIAETARKDVQGILFEQINITRIFKEGLLVLPEVIDILTRSPLVISESLRYVENYMKTSREGPFADIKGTLFGSFCLITGAVIYAVNGPFILWGFFFLAGFTFAGHSFLKRR